MRLRLREAAECAGGIVLGPDGRLVLTRKVHKSSFSFPKGHVDPEDVSHESAARREIAEETGLTELRLAGYLGSFVRRSSKGELKRIHLYLYSTGQTLLRPTDPRHLATWHRPREAELLLRRHHSIDADQMQIYARQIHRLAQAIRRPLELAL